MSDHYRMVRNKLLGQSLDDWSPRDTWVRNMVIIITFTLSTAAFQSQNGLGSLVIIIGGGTLYLVLMRLNGGNARLYEEVELFQKDTAYIAGMKKRLSKHAATAESGGDPRVSLPYEEADTYVPTITQNVIKVTDEYGVTHRIPILSSLDPDKPFDYLYIRVEGGRFVDNENPEQKAAIDELSSIVDTTLMMTKLKAGIGSLYIRAPADPYDDYDYYKMRGNPLITRSSEFRVIDPSLQRLTTNTSASFENTNSMMRAYGMSDPVSLFVITIQRDKTTSNLFSGGTVPEDSVYNLPVLMLARDFVGRLQASPTLGYEDVSIVREHELCMIVRQSWDITGISRFYEEIVPYRRLLERGEWNEAQYADYLWTTVGCLPATFRSLGPECIDVEGNYLSLIREEEVPEYVFPNVENSLLRQAGDTNVWLRSAALGLGSSAKIERARVYGQKASATNLSRALFSGLTIMPDSVETKREELDEQSAMLRKVALVQRFEIYAGLVTASPQALTQGTAKYIGLLKGRRHNPATVTNTALHKEKFLAAVLGIHS